MNILHRAVVRREVSRCRQRRRGRGIGRDTGFLRPIDASGSVRGPEMEEEMRDAGYEIWDSKCFIRVTIYHMLDMRTNIQYIISKINYCVSRISHLVSCTIQLD